MGEVGSPSETLRNRSKLHFWAIWEFAFSEIEMTVSTWKARVGGEAGLSFFLRLVLQY